MATEQEILAGLAEILEEIAGVPPADVSRGEVLHRRPGRRLAVHGRGRRGRRGEVRRQDPGRRAEEPQDRRRRRRLHQQEAPSASTHRPLGVTADRRVVVTGLGATTPLGGDVASTWEACSPVAPGSARSPGVGRQLPVRIAAQLAVEPTEVLDRVEARRLDRSEQIALIAAREAWADAGFADSGRSDPRAARRVVGTGIGGAHHPARARTTSWRAGPAAGLPATPCRC